MYSVVMMAAMMAGAETTDFGGGRGWYPGCYGCYGYGCYSACHGCYGCGGWSHGCGGCSGYGGGCYGWSCWGCYGCWGSSSYYPMYQYQGHGTIVVPGTTMPGVGTGAGDMKKIESSLPPPNMSHGRARLTVAVPADAKLFIDDQPMKATSAVRQFRTPELKDGQTYYYILKVELARSGVTHTETKRVLLKAGDEVKESFTEESIAPASKAGSSAKR